jgi:uncharacterized caspase-like protein
MSISTEHKTEITGKKKALIIGISDYNELRPLDLCKNDAEEMLRVLSEQGYEITDDYKLIGQVDANQMKNAIYDFFDNDYIKYKDTLLFYFSGHGIPDGFGKHFLAPSDIDKNRPGRKGISFEDLDYCIENSKSRRILAVLDCCFSGAAGLEGLKDDDDSAAKKARESMERRINASEGRCILASSLSDQQSVIRKDLGHSLFTYHLLEGLKGKSGYVDDNGFVTADLLGKYVFEKIVDEPRQLQKPIRKSKASGDLIVAHHPHMARREPEQFQATSSPTPSTSSADTYMKMMEADRYEKNEDYESALSCYEEAIAIDPNNYMLYNRKGDALLKMGRNKEAIKTYDEAIIARPEHPDAYDLKGHVYFKLEEYQKALEYYDKALKIKPNSFEFLKDKGLVLHKLKEYKQALEFFDEALKINPDHSSVLQYKKEASRNLKKIDQPKKEANSTRVKPKSSVQARPPSRTVSVAWDAIIDKKVKSIDNQDIGKVLMVSQNIIRTQEGGMFSRKHYFIPKYYYDNYDGNSIWVSLTKHEIKSRFERNTSPTHEEIFTRDYVARKRKIDSEFPRFSEGIPYGRIIESDRQDIKLGKTRGTEAYCVKCKVKRRMNDEKQVTMKNGQKALMGICPICGTKMFKIRN